MGVVDPSEYHLIVFDSDWSEHPLLPTSFAFQIPVKTLATSASVWKQLRSPEVSPSTITLRAWDGHSSEPIDLFRNCPITLAVKIVCIDVEVIYAPLD